MHFNIYDIDIYSKLISFFFDKKEKIGSVVGIALTLIYILTSIILLVYYIETIIQRQHMNVYDSTVYSNDIPIIEVNPNLIYFAFGLEDPKTSNRFVDETIYYPIILFFDRVKVNGEFVNAERRVLEYEVCKEENFGENYKHLFIKGELNNSYCLKNYNLTLTGGYKYERMSYFRIKIYPCLNKTENNNHCKPQEVIDTYLKGGYFSILTKDIGLNPSNFTFPVLSTLQDLYTTIDKSIYRDYILYYGITEIQTDVGLFIEQIESEKYLQFRKEYTSFYFRDESEYYAGKAMISIAFRLDDLIKIQSRKYTKMPEIFSTIGGYMQLLNTVFTLIAIFHKRLTPELKILNGIFRFNLEQRKMMMKINSIKDFNKSLSKNSNKYIYFPDSDCRNQSNNNNLSTNNVSRISLIGINEASSDIKIINTRKQNEYIDKKENKKEENCNNGNASILMNTQNRKSSKFCLENNSNKIGKKSKNYIYRVGSFYPKNILKRKEKNENDISSNFNGKEKDKDILKKYTDVINFNIFDYYCLGRISKKREQIVLFNSGISLYKKRMDIINVFTLLFLAEKNCLQIDH